MGEKHLDLLTFVARHLVGLGLAALSGELARLFMGLARDVSRIGFRTADLFGWAGLTGRFQAAVFLSSTGVLPPVRIGVVPAELLEGVPFGTDVLVIRLVPLEV